MRIRRGMLSFWLGLPGMLFLLWAWVDSRHHPAEVEYSRGGPHLWNVTHGSSRLVVTIRSWAPDSEAAWGPQYRFARSQSFLPADPVKLLQVPYYSSAGDARTAKPNDILFRQVAVPHWLAVLIYIGIWSCLMLWRVRVRGRHLQSGSGTSPDSAL
jgi:hypothetical protein